MIGAFLWAGATHVARGGEGAQQAAGAAGAPARPAGDRRSRRPAARRGDPARAGGATPGSVVIVATTGGRRASSTRRPSSPPRSSAVPGCRSATSPAGSRTACRCRPTSSGEPLLRAMNRTPATRVRPGRARRLDLRRPGRQGRRRRLHGPPERMADDARQPRATTVVAVVRRAPRAARAGERVRLDRPEGPQAQRPAGRRRDVLHAQGRRSSTTR